jgi:lipid A 3-O-deacylase PagL
MFHCWFAPAAFALGLLFHLTPVMLFAQQRENDNIGRNSFEIIGCGSLGNASLKGTTFDRGLFELGLSYNRRLLRRKTVGLRFVSEAIPLALLREPFFKNTEIQARFQDFQFTAMQTSYGLGAKPVGILLTLFPQKKIEPLVGVHSGFLYFDRNVLSARASQFNFTIDGSIGLRFRLQAKTAISLSYMFQHMSNAYAAVENPGVDFHMIRVGYSFPFSRHKR